MTHKRTNICVSIRNNPRYYVRAMNPREQEKGRPEKPAGGGENFVEDEVWPLVTELEDRK